MIFIYLGSQKNLSIAFYLFETPVADPEIGVRFPSRGDPALREWTEASTGVAGAGL